MMHKYSSGRGLALLLACTLGLAVAGCGASLTAEERVEKARAEFEQGKPSEAAIHLRNVLQDDPSNTPARVLLARAALRLGDLETAAKEFRRALDLGADVDEFRAEYAEALVRVGAGDEALRVTDPAEADADPEISYWRALALLRTGDVDGAERLFMDVQQSSDLAVRAQVGLARVKLARGQPEAALALLDQLAGEAEGSSDYWETVAIASAQTGQPELAAEAFAKAAATVVDAVGAQRLVYQGGEVEALLSAGQLDEARARAERMHARVRQHPFANYLMGRVELQSGNAQQALAYGQAVLAAQPDSAQGHMIIGMAYLSMNQGLQAERSFERALVQDPNNANVRRLLAQTRLGLQSPERALEALGPVTDEALDTGVAALAGMASVRAGDPAAAIEIFRRQLARDPANDEARSMLAVSLMAAGRVDEALAELAQVSSDDAAVRQRADLIEVAAHLQEGAIDAAREASARIAEAHPDDAQLRANLGGLFLAANRADEAAAWLGESLRIDPGNLAARFNLGRIAAAMGRVDEARAHFEHIIASDPGNTAALAALAQLDWAQGEREKAIAQLQQAREAEPGEVNARLLMAGYLGNMGRLEEATTVAREAVANAPNSASAANALGAALLQSGDPRDALAEFNRAHAINPAESLYILNKARAELALGDIEVGRESLVKALALEPESARALGLMVEVERRLGRLENAARTLARLEQVLPAGDARVQLLRGQLLVAQGDFLAAEQAFAAAQEAGAGNRALVGRFDARRRANGPDPAGLLVEWLNEYPEDASIRVLLADHYIQSGAYPAAAAEYEKLLAVQPDSALMLNNLAWLYSQAGDERARSLAERAHELSPDSPMIADTYGWILFQAGEHSRALELISKAAAAAPGVGEIQYHHAVVLAETGDREGAIRAARAVLSEPSAANFHEPAQRLLERIEQGKE